MKYHKGGIRIFPTGRSPQKWEPKLNAPRDNGILFHCTGPHGAFWNVWKSSVEFQVEEKGMGDLYALSGTSATASVVKGRRPNIWEFDPEARALAAGQLQIQSEGAEAYYCRIEIRNIGNYPPEIRSAAGLDR